MEDVAELVEMVTAPVHRDLGDLPEVVETDVATAIAVSDCSPLRGKGQRYRQMAKAASAGLMTHQHVEFAAVEISGTSDDLVFHLQCTLIPDVDPSTVMELLAHRVIPNVERLFEERFASRDLRFVFSQGDSRPR